MRGGKCPRFALEAVLPVAMPNGFDQVAPYRQPTGLPLAQHVKVLVQNQIVISPEVAGRMSQENETFARRCTCTEVQSAVTGAFNDAYVRDRLAKNLT
jgi:hypothetical protein